MKELSAKQEAFYLKWEQQRKKKWLYVFVHGIIYYGIPFGILYYFLLNRFNTENMDLYNFFTTLTIFGFGGILPGLRQYNNHEKAFLSLNDDGQIFDGIKMLETGSAWNYENLIIKKQDNYTLVIKNELFWFEDDALTNNLNDCLNVVRKDVDRLKTNKDFNIYSSQYNVKIQLFNNSDKEKPLIEVNI